MSPGDAPRFRRELGLWDALLVVAGGIVGVGIFANPANVARILDQPSLILMAWGLGGLVALAGGFIWAELAARFPHTGGQYVYLARAYHPLVGFLYGVALLLIINGGGLAAVAIVFASYVDRGFVPLGEAGVRATAGATLIALTVANTVGVRTGKRTNNALMIAKLAGIGALLAVVLAGGGAPASRFEMPRPEGGATTSLHLLFTALVPILFAYGGWQSCASIAGEIRDPARNLARANVLGVVLVVVVYLALNLAYLWVLPPQSVAASTALAADVARAAAGEAGARLVSGLILVSSLGFLAVVIMTGPRLCYAMARDGLFFRQAARLHPRYRTPVFALWFQTGVALVLLSTNTYDQLLSYVVFADWLFFGLTAGAVVLARRREAAGAPAGANQVQGFRVPGHPFTTWAFIGVAIGVVANSFVAYPRQSLVGTAILLAATAAFFGLGLGRRAGAAA